MNKHNHLQGSLPAYVLSCVLSILVVALMITVPGCAEEKSPPSPQPAIPAPKPAPTPSPAPTVDEPSLLEEEACNRVWSELPYNLPDGYKKTQFSTDTIKATYERNGK